MKGPLKPEELKMTKRIVLFGLLIMVGYIAAADPVFGHLESGVYECDGYDWTIHVVGTNNRLFFIDRYGQPRYA
jgi:hypothetical protein